MNYIISYSFNGKTKDLIVTSNYEMETVIEWMKDRWNFEPLSIIPVFKEKNETKNKP